MSEYGLIGKTLTHSFSKEYFTKKFDQLNINSTYNLFELNSINDFIDLKSSKNLKGLNVTIPYKKEIIPFLDEIDSIAKNIGAVNTVKFENGKSIGYNSDYFGFKDSLLNFIPDTNFKAIILGTGGGSLAVQQVLKNLNIDFLLTSRNPQNNEISYFDLSELIISEHLLIINTTPLGMYPEVHELPNIPYEFITKNHYCFDLIYNPETTSFLKKVAQNDAKIMNGLEMLHLQAEKSWEIWNS